jgi:hypothetical protein
LHAISVQETKEEAMSEQQSPGFYRQIPVNAKKRKRKRK